MAARRRSQDVAGRKTMIATLGDFAMRVLPRWLRQIPSGLGVLALLIAGGSAPAPADDDPCAGFRWDLRKERALFAGAPASLPAGKDGASAPSLVPDRLYELKLLPASEVTFPVPPGKASPDGAAYAGVFALNLSSAGSYRVAIDLPFWIDVAANGKLVPAADYEGQHGCSAPRKVVEFALTGSQHWWLQLNGASQAVVRLTITSVLAGSAKRAERN